MIRVAVVGLGKMGMSHQSMINVHPDVTLAAVCDPTGYVLDILSKYTGVKTYANYDKMLAEEPLDAVIIATPSRFHAQMVRAALERGLHVFCEKPFVLEPSEGAELAAIARDKGLANQVGYHYRFVGAFAEVKKLVDQRAIGTVTHVMAEAYGPVVLRPKGATWRTQRAEGGGCLYDYAAHPINLLNWYFGEPATVGGSVLGKIFSTDTEDEVYGTLFFNDGMTAQLSVNWSDESYRKMSTKLTLWGTGGRIVADRQECQVFIRDGESAPAGYGAGWNVKYTTDLTDSVWFYLRGEEYSAQLDHFVKCVRERRVDNVNSFESAAMTDRVIGMLIADADRGPGLSTGPVVAARRKKRWAIFG